MAATRHITLSAERFVDDVHVDTAYVHRSMIARRCRYLFYLTHFPSIIISYVYRSVLIPIISRIMSYSLFCRTLVHLSMSSFKYFIVIYSV